jgi:hypothetical protein
MRSSEVMGNNSWSSRPSEARAGTHNHRWIDLCTAGAAIQRSY